MFKWSSYDALPLDEDVHEWQAGTQTLLFQDEAFWGNGQHVANELDDIPDTSQQDVHHELLTREQEQKLAAKLSDAFSKLQAQLAGDPAYLEKMLAQVLEEETDLNAQDVDRVLTLYDTLLVYGFLKARDARFESEFELVWHRLQEAFTNIALNRDFVLALAHQAKKYKTSLDRIYGFRNQFVTSNIRLVYHVARRHIDKGMALDDMVQEGILGLIRAALKFDAAVGVRFSTYSFWWIKQAIRQALSKQRSMIRFPTHVNDQVNRLYAFKSEFLLINGRLPTENELHRELKLSVTQIRDLSNLTNLCVSANAALFDDSPRNLQDDLIYPSGVWSPEESMIESQQGSVIQKVFAVLDQREATILAMKFGIGHRKAYSLNEISPQMGISRERVRQIIEEAKEKIRQHGGVLITAHISD